MYDKVFSFFKGLAVVEKDGKFGYINDAGIEILHCEYDSVGAFNNNISIVEKDGKWGCVNKTGKEVVPCEYQSLHNFSEGLAAVEKDDKWGFIDKTGKVVIPIQYDSAWNFSEGIAEVELDGKSMFYGWKFDKDEPYIGQILECDLNCDKYREIVEKSKLDQFPNQEDYLDDDLCNICLSRLYGMHMQKLEQAQYREDIMAVKNDLLDKYTDFSERRKNALQVEQPNKAKAQEELHDKFYAAVGKMVLASFDKSKGNDLSE